MIYKVNADNGFTYYYDGLACYGEHGGCICAECYHIGAEATGCNVPNLVDMAQKVTWDGNKYVPVNE